MSDSNDTELKVFDKMMTVPKAVRTLVRMLNYRRRKLEEPGDGNRPVNDVVAECRALERALFSLESEMDVEPVSQTEEKIGE